MLGEDKFIKAREGDLKSLEEICAGTWESLYRFIYYKVQNREEAEDITQEAYEKAFSHLRRTNVEIGSFTGFLRTISLNVLRDKWRKRKRQGIGVAFDERNTEEAAPDDQAEASARRELVETALNRLNEEQRKVIELRIIKGYSTAETARIMNKKAGTVRVLQYRALQNLEALLENDDRDMEV